LKKAITPLMLWGLGVGYVISGMYCGWNLGLKEGGTLGLAIATLFIIVLYVAFSFSYAELACAIPKAGGVFDYASRALGKDIGFLAGMAQNIEFIFAPPAISFAIGAYFNLFYPDIPIVHIAIAVYVLFTALNIYGVQAAARFELIITVLAVGELLLFSGVTLPHFQWRNLTHHALPNGWMGIFAAIPFAIWFFLGIEGIANVAEETIAPQKNISRGFGSTILTLVILCVLTFVSAIGVNGWETVVYNADGAVSDSPLPLAMAKIVGNNSFLFHILITVGLFGLVASFNGLLLAAGRSSFEFGRVGFAPGFIGKVHPKFKTPANALLVNMGIGILALLTNKTGEIITIAVFGALSLYVVSMISLIVLRIKEAELPRPYKAPFYPYSPIIALVISLVSLVSITYFSGKIALIYLGFLLVSYLCFKLFYKKDNSNE
jgi:ethanolamine permease